MVSQKYYASIDTDIQLIIVIFSNTFSREIFMRNAYSMSRRTSLFSKFNYQVFQLYNMNSKLFGEIKKEVKYLHLQKFGNLQRELMLGTSIYIYFVFINKSLTIRIYKNIGTTCSYINIHNIRRSTKSRASSMLQLFRANKYVKLFFYCKLRIEYLYSNSENYVFIVCLIQPTTIDIYIYTH